jgi:hypothetical protein
VARASPRKAEMHDTQARRWNFRFFAPQRIAAIVSQQ